MRSIFKGSTSLLAAVAALAAASSGASAQETSRADEQAARQAFTKVPNIRSRFNTSNAVAEVAARGKFLAGDKHNHTTCSDGSTSPKILADQSMVAFGLDWFGMVGHGGGGTRDCRFTDADYSTLVGVTAAKNRAQGGDEGMLWSDTIGNDAILGDEVFSTSRVQDDPATEDRERAKVMWRWQSVRDFQYQDIAIAGIQANKPAFTGLEWVVPGHEHASAAVLDGQFPGGVVGEVGNADKMAQFEYLWDRADADTTGGKFAGFEDAANNGVEKIPNVAGDHDKSVFAVQWLRANHPVTSFAVAAHTERQGGFVPGENRGYNVEHLRDWHNAGLLDQNDIESYSVSFGMEGQAGHQAGSTRGTYSNTRPSAGLGTFGGAGAYAGAEVTLPGKDFNGNDLTLETAVALGLPESEFTSNPIERLVLGRPGVRTMWDAMLGEGRRFFVVGSSDWHNRGSYGPFEPASTLDFWPGEYQKMYSYVTDTQLFGNVANGVVRGLRSGNTYSVMGDLIGPDFYFVACYDRTGECVTMGQELTVREGLGNVTFEIQLTDPEGKNNSPYEFNNPSLEQIGMEVPMDEPVLHHVDIIVGDVTGEIAPFDSRYQSTNSNPSTRRFFTFDDSNWLEGSNGLRRMRWTVPVADMDGDNYVRVMGTNMPQGVPNETDADGNPLSDNLAGNIACNATSEAEGFDPAACPDHLPTDENGTKFIAFDVESWADLWFHASPIFIDVEEGRRRPRRNQRASAQDTQTFAGTSRTQNAFTTASLSSTEASSGGAQTSARRGNLNQRVRRGLN